MSLDDYLSFTTRGALVGSGNSIAWAEITRGVVNLFGASISGGGIHQLTNNSVDEGTSFANIHFVRSAACPQGLLLWTQGPSNGVNPTSTISPPPAQQIMALPFQLGAPEPAQALGPHELVTVTPDGTRALYAMSTSPHGLALCELTTDIMTSRAPPPPGPAACAHTKGSSLLLRVSGSSKLGFDAGGAARWSPDGQTLAIAIHRFDHGAIGLYRRGADRLHWVAPSLDTDDLPRWSADGARLAFVRFRADALDVDGLASVDRGVPDGPTFSVLVADVASAWRGGQGAGQGAARTRRFGSVPVPVREVHREWDHGYTGFGANGYGARPLLWAANDTRLLVGSEASGFVRVLSVAAAGDVRAGTNASVALTAAGCDTQDWRLSPGSGEELYTAHNCDDVDSLGVARVQVRTGATSSVVAGTPGSIAGMGAFDAGGDGGSGLLPLAIAGGVAYVRSTHNLPATVWVRTAAVTARMLPHPPPPSVVASFQPPRVVTFPSSDGLFTLHAFLYVATATSNNDVAEDGAANLAARLVKHRPAVIYTHGGAMRQMYPALHYTHCYAALGALNQALAHGGASVLSLNYRGGVGYGRAFRRCEGSRLKCGWQGATEYEDVRAARAWLERTLAPSAVGIHGLSYGGLNCLQALARDSSDYAAGACNAPVFSWVTDQGGHARGIFHGAPTHGGYRQLPAGPEPDVASPSWALSAKANLALAWRSSPAAYVENWTAPVLLLQGDLDESVWFQESRGVQRALRRRKGGEKNVVETFVVPDEDHGMALYEHQVAAAEAIHGFLQRFLKLPPLSVASPEAASPPLAPPALASPPLASPPVGVGRGREDPIASVESAIKAYIAQKEVAGPAFSLTLIVNGSTVLQQGYGSHTRGGTPSTRRTLFHMASITKTFTALAMMQLVERGRCSLNDTLVSVLPEFVLADPRHKDIRLWHVLSHTSGLPDEMDFAWYDNPNCTGPDNALDKYIRALRNLDRMKEQGLVDYAGMLSAPGAKYRYSNLGFDILGEVVARLSDEPDWDSYVLKNIVRPLGMRDTVTKVRQADVALLAAPHVLSTWDPALSKPTSPRMAPTSIYPDNCIHAPSSDITTNAVDMSRYVLMQLRHGELDHGIGGRIRASTSLQGAAAPGRLLSEASWRFMMNPLAFTNTPDDPFERQVGVSWFIGTYEGRRTLSHAGGDTGMLSHMVLVPECNGAMVWMTNGDGYALSNQQAVTRGLQEIQDRAMRVVGRC